MREYPWHQRKALLKHHRWFRNLAEFHDITRSWASETKLDQSDNPHFTSELKLLDRMTDVRLEMLLDDTAPEDLLGRLEHSVRTAQLWTYLNVAERVDDSVLSALEKVTIQQGNASAQKRWSRIGESQRDDLRAIFLTLVDSPMALSLGENAFLLRRGLARELEFEFRSCPHENPFAEVGTGINELCRLHSAWIHGYVQGLNPRAVVTYRPRSGDGSRCSQHWRLAPAD